jgi:hypothetical protein
VCFVVTACLHSFFVSSAASAASVCLVCDFVCLSFAVVSVWVIVCSECVLVRVSVHACARIRLRASAWLRSCVCAIMFWCGQASTLVCVGLCLCGRKHLPRMCL